MIFRKKILIHHLHVHVHVLLLLLLLLLGRSPPYYEMARVFVVVVVVGSSSLIIRFRSNAVLNKNQKARVVLCYYY